MVSTIDRLGAGACLLVVAGDAAQFAAKPLGTDLLAPGAGAGLYAILAIGLLRDHRIARWIVIGMPAVPATTALTWTLGLHGRAPDGWMAGVALFQLLAAGLAWRGRS